MLSDYRLHTNPPPPVTAAVDIPAMLVEQVDDIICTAFTQLHIVIGYVWFFISAKDYPF